MKNLSVWFKSKSSRSPGATTRKAAVPDGLRIYAIGDVHGCSHLLDSLATKVAQDLAERPVPSALAVFLGDYVDRGPASARVLQRLARGDFPCATQALRGNHEAMLLTFLDDASYLDAWRRFGGLETLHSFGIDVSRMLTEADFERARAALDDALAPEIRGFLAATPTYFSSGDYYFCHAGIRPGVPLAAQREEDLLWIREEFLASPAEHGAIVVHGHTPVEQPDVRANRINIDTGAYLSGTLTALVLEGAERHFIAT